MILCATLITDVFSFPPQLQESGDSNKDEDEDNEDDEDRENEVSGVFLYWCVSE